MKRRTLILSAAGIGLSLLVAPVASQTRARLSIASVIDGEPPMRGDVLKAD
ncbi:hypothetical protein [Brevundimonas sp.]|uniref:hypothetical protein n=1 Tax=Brevundimonas sp. TaxID=1871086 RepID=UPI002489E885|nr:hypothetical protein [Brevundimonas sp.]MDI1282201.1 hypothetical protein [Brevundimonas sp.]